MKNLALWVVFCALLLIVGIATLCIGDLIALAIFLIFGALAVFCYICINHEKTKKYSKAIIVSSAVVGAVILIVLIVVSGAKSGSSDSGGCAICGEPIFAGKFCKKHFNEWASDNWNDNFIWLIIKYCLCFF